MVDTIQVFVPTGVVAGAVAGKAAARQGARADLVIGLLDNHKHGTEQILTRLEQRLGEQFAPVRFVRAKKEDAGRGASKKIIEDLGRECCVVVNGVAD